MTTKLPLSDLTAISVLDGRYAKQNDKLRKIFSEYGLIKNRLAVEVFWLEKLSKHLDGLNISNKDLIKLNNLVKKFSIEDASKIKDIEKQTNHDVMAVVYFLIEYCQSKLNTSQYTNFIHFACTSEDINNLSYALMLSEAKTVLLDDWQKIISKLENIAKEYKEVAILSRTHGQPASPSTIGKEIAVFAYRLNRQYKQLQDLPILAKINGAVGCFNAHSISYSDVDWQSLANDFISGLDLAYNPLTTQIEPHDNIAQYLNIVNLFNTILIDFNRDIWQYISMDYFKQKKISTEVGSSTMPHKVNPMGK